jgi:phosphohistidine phosphatase
VVGVKTLLLLRHAKSSWDDPALDDRARPLAPRGIRAARRIAVRLHDGQLRPDLVLCSSARRARQTLDALQSVLGEATDVQIEDELYAASSRAILRCLRVVDPAVTTVMVIGHNPGLEDLAVDLTSDGDPAAVKQLHTRFPTAALAIFDLGQVEWAGLGPGRAYLRDIVLPRHLRD